MHAGDTVPPVERAIELAAWVSVHLLEPVPFERDEIAKTLNWKDDIEQLDEDVFIKAMPPPRAAAQSPSAAAPGPDLLLPHSADQSVDGGLDEPDIATHLLPLRYYHFFEACIDPRDTEADKVLDAIANAVRARPGTWAQGRAFAHGGFAVSCHGLTSSTRICVSTKSEDAKGYTRIQQSHDEWTRQQTTPPRWSLEDRDQSLAGWSEQWREWFRTHGPVRPGPDDAEYRLHHRLDPDRDWGPPCDRSIRLEPPHVGPRLMSTVHDCSPATLESLLTAVYRDRLATFLRARTRLGRAQGLRHLVKRLLGRPIAPDTETVTPLDATELASPDAHAALRHLLFVSDDSRVVSAALAQGSITLPETTETDRSALERLADLAIAAFQMADRSDDLTAMVKGASGTLQEQTLHFLQLRGDDALLSLTAIPRVAEAFAQLACAPLHLLDGIDQSNRGLLQELHSHIHTVMDYQVAPPIGPRHQPIKFPDRAAASDVNRARSRIEYLFKLALQHLFALSRCATRSAHDTPSTAHSGTAKVASATDTLFWDLDRFDDAFGPIDDPLSKCRGWGSGKFTLSELVHLSSIMTRTRNAAHAPWQHVCRGLTVMKTLCGQLDLPRRGNRASHDTPNDPTDYLDDLDCFRRFDSDVCNGAALPRFYVCRSVTHTLNHPTEVHFLPYACGAGVTDAQSLRAYFSGWLARRNVWRADRIYSVTDRTNNSISINPIVLDWTDWLTDRDLEVRETHDT